MHLPRLLAFDMFQPAAQFDHRQAPAWFKHAKLLYSLMPTDPIDFQMFISCSLSHPVTIHSSNPIWLHSTQLHLCFSIAYDVNICKCTVIYRYIHMLVSLFYFTYNIKTTFVVIIFINQSFKSTKSVTSIKSFNSIHSIHPVKSNQSILLCNQLSTITISQSIYSSIWSSRLYYSYHASFSIVIHHCLCHVYP